MTVSDGFLTPDLQINGQGQESQEDHGFADGGTEGDTQAQFLDADGESQQQSEQRLYAGKFKSVDDLEKSYMNLQPKFTQVTQELSALKKQLYTQQPDAFAMQAQYFDDGAVDRFGSEQDATTYIAQLARQQAHEMVAPLQNKLVELEISSTLRSLKEQNPEEFDMVAPKVLDVLNENPALFSLQNFVDVAYKLAKADISSEMVNSAAQKATARAYANQDIKTLNTSGGATAKQNITKKSPAEQIVDDIMSSGKGGGIFGF